MRHTLTHRTSIHQPSIRRQAVLLEACEPRRLLAGLAELVTTSALPRHLSLTDQNIYYGVDPKIDGKSAVTSIERVGKPGDKPFVLQPQRNQQWDLNNFRSMTAGRDRAWIYFRDTSTSTAQLWSIRDKETRATQVLNLPTSGWFNDLQVSHDRSRVYFSIETSASGSTPRQEQLWTSDGTKDGTRTVGDAVYSISDLVATPRGMLYGSQVRSSDKPRLTLIPSDKPATSRLLDVDIQYAYARAAVLANDNVVIQNGGRLYLADATFSKIRELDLPADSESSNLGNLAAIDGGFAFTSNSKVWVAKPDGTGIRMVGTIGGSLSSTILTHGSVFSMYPRSSIGTGSIAIYGGYGTPVEPTSTLSSQGLYHISVEHGLGKISDQGVSRTIGLADGSVYGFASTLEETYEYVDLTDKANVRVVRVPTLDAASNGKRIAFAHGLKGNEVMLLSPEVRTNIVQGKIELTAAGKDLRDSFHSAQYHRSTRVWLDLNNDGKRQSSEPSQMLNGPQFLFKDVVASRPFTIRVEGPWTEHVKDRLSSRVSKPQIGNVIEHNFAYQLPAAGIEFRAFHDRNGDGKRDDGETWMKRIEFYDSDANGKQTGSSRAIPNARSASNGRVLHRNLPIRNITVHAAAPRGYYATSQPTRTLVLEPGKTTLVEVGFKEDPNSAAIVAKVHVDGVPVNNSSQARYDNRRLTLLDSNNRTVAILTPNSKNEITFRNLSAGTYKLQYKPVSGYSTKTVQINLTGGQRRRLEVDILT